MARRRVSGLLLHPTSLPGGLGIGELGEAAYRFVDFMCSCGQTLWQVLPLGPTGYGDSPYQCFSAFAGNPLLVSVEALLLDGLLVAEDVAEVPPFLEHSVEFGAVKGYRWGLLRRAHQRFVARNDRALHEQVATFQRAQRHWLEDYALFAALKDAHDGAPWTAWKADIRDREPAALQRWRHDLATEIDLHVFVQFVFAHQWSALRAYANQRGVRILGDIPIFVAHDSADVWANPDLFHLAADGMPLVVAGVPPDYFSSTGQLWGNPLYRWDVMAERGYSWWLERFRAALTQADLVRIDHFRGFEAYWEIPASAATAAQGTWVKGPGEAIFDVLREELGTLPIVAEDLGLITPEVRALRRAIGVPGMSVLHFAFGDTADNLYLPHNHRPECVLYTGTHDNNTTAGWYDDISDRERHRVRMYLGCDGNDIAWDLIRCALRSVADTVVIPVQDLLGLGSTARMNTPAQQGGNWGWRISEGLLDEAIGSRLGELTRLFGRWPDEEPEV